MKRKRRTRKKTKEQVGGTIFVEEGMTVNELVEATNKTVRRIRREIVNEERTLYNLIHELSLYVDELGIEGFSVEGDGVAYEGAYIVSRTIGDAEIEIESSQLWSSIHYAKLAITLEVKYNGVEIEDKTYKNAVLTSVFDEELVYRYLLVKIEQDAKKRSLERKAKAEIKQLYKGR